LKESSFKFQCSSGGEYYRIEHGDICYRSGGGGLSVKFGIPDFFRNPQKIHYYKMDFLVIRFLVLVSARESFLYAVLFLGEHLEI